MVDFLPCSSNSGKKKDISDFKKDMYFKNIKFGANPYSNKGLKPGATTEKVTNKKINNNDNYHKLMSIGNPSQDESEEFPKLNARDATTHGSHEGKLRGGKREINIAKEDEN